MIDFRPVYYFTQELNFAHYHMSTEWSALVKGIISIISLVGQAKLIFMTVYYRIMSVTSLQ